MQILTKAGGIAMTNSHMVADEIAKQAVIFDAPDNTVAPLLDQAVERGWDVIGLWLTHGHFDHFADHTVVRRRFPKAKILIHKSEALKTAQPEVQTRLFRLSIKIEPLKADAYVTDNQVLQIGSMEVHVIFTPGHAPGHVCYYFPNEKLLIGGDLIIGGSVGRTDLPDSNHHDMEASLRRVMALPPETRLLGGHGPDTTLAHERQTNYFLRDFLDNP